MRLRIVFDAALERIVDLVHCPDERADPAQHRRAENEINQKDDPAIAVVSSERDDRWEEEENNRDQSKDDSPDR